MSHPTPSPQCRLRDLAPGKVARLVLARRFNGLVRQLQTNIHQQNICSTRLAHTQPPSLSQSEEDVRGNAVRESRGSFGNEKAIANEQSFLYEIEYLAVKINCLWKSQSSLRFWRVFGSEAGFKWGGPQPTSQRELGVWESLARACRHFVRLDGFAAQPLRCCRLTARFPHHHQNAATSNKEGKIKKTGKINNM